MAEQEAENQYRMLDFQDQVRRWQVKFGLQRDEAQMIATRDNARMEAVAKVKEAQINKAWEAIKLDTENQQEWQITVLQTQTELAKASEETRRTILRGAYENLFATNRGPGVRRMAWETIKYLGGVAPDLFNGFTPDEMKALGEYEKLMIGNATDKALFPFVVSKAKSEAEIKDFENRTKETRLSMDIQKLQQEINESNSLINYRAVMGITAAQGQALKEQEFEAKLSGQLGDNGAPTLGEIIGNKAAEFDKAIGEGQAKIDQVRADLAGMEAKVLKDEEVARNIKEATSDPGWFQKKRTPKEKEEARRRIIQEELAGNPQYVELKRQLEQKTAAHESVVARRDQLRSMSPNGFNPQNVSLAVAELGKTKTPQAYAEKLEELLSSGRIGIMDVVQAAKTRPVPGDPGNELIRKLLIKHGEMVLGTSQMGEAWANEILGGGTPASGGFPELGGGD
jgi:hypothetical protein